MVGRRGMMAAVALAALALAACGGDGGDAGGADGGKGAAVEGTYVGTVEGTEAYIALVSDGETVAGYLCDGEQVSVWLDQVEVADGGAELLNRDGETVGEATFEGDQATGEVTVDGEAHPFTAEVATGDAGLYGGTQGERGEPGFVEAGWIVLPDGSQRGATNFIDPHADDIVIQPAPNLQPGAGSVSIPGQGAVLRVQKFVNPTVD